MPRAADQSGKQLNGKSAVLFKNVPWLRQPESNLQHPQSMTDGQGVLTEVYCTEVGGAARSAKPRAPHGRDFADEVLATLACAQPTLHWGSRGRSSATALALFFRTVPPIKHNAGMFIIQCRIITQVLPRLE